MSWWIEGDPALTLRPVIICMRPGRPRTKGSLKPQRVRGGGGELTGRTRLVDTPQSSRWRREMVAEVAKRRGIEMRELTKATPVMTDGPVRVDLMFVFDRPDSNADPFPTAHTIGDIDKLDRNALDALTDARVYPDDSMVVEVRSAKLWAGPGIAAGAYVAVWAL